MPIGQFQRFTSDAAFNDDRGVHLRARGKQEGQMNNPDRLRPDDISPLRLAMEALSLAQPSSWDRNKGGGSKGLHNDDGSHTGLYQCESVRGW